VAAAAGTWRILDILVRYKLGLTAAHLAAHIPGGGASSGEGVWHVLDGGGVSSGGSSGQGRTGPMQPERRRH
jgi:hypothetical protein